MVSRFPLQTGVLETTALNVKADVLSCPMMGFWLGHGLPNLPIHHEYRSLVFTTKMVVAKSLQFETLVTLEFVNSCKSNQI